MTPDFGVISGVSVAHQRATVDQIQATGAETQRAGVESLLSRPGVEEAFVLQTCNRYEAYVVTADPWPGRAALEETIGGVPRESVTTLGHEGSLRHLMRVAAGLESLVVGEDQILGQVRDAYEVARGVGAVGTVLEDAVTKAIHVGERARTETAINEGAVSLGSAAVRLAAAERDLEAATALVVGAGEMGTRVARALEDRVERVVVANRTRSRAGDLVDSLAVEAEAVGLADLEAALAGADLLVTATDSQDPVVDADALAGAGETFVVDIAQPRDVPAPAGDLAEVTLRDLDDLEAVTDGTMASRRAAAESVEDIVDRELEHLLVQYKRKRADEVIAAMYESAEQVKARELRTALGKLEGLDPDQREVVESLADSLVGQLLAPPTRSLRDAAEQDDWSTINTALQLFDPEFGPDRQGTGALSLPEHLSEGAREGRSAAVRDEAGED